MTGYRRVMGVAQGGGRTAGSRSSDRSGATGAAGLPAPELQAYYAGESNPRGRTTEAVSDALREAILDGVLAPSAWLREDELAAVFNVSRTPVREALRRLSDEGLAIKTVHHGTIVAPLSLDDILALYVVREDLEGVAARLAATRRPEGLLLGLREIHADMIVLAETGEVSELARQNLAFHRLLREATGNSYLERFLTQVEHAVRRVPSTFTCPGRPEAVLLEHAVLMDALDAGDAEAAEKAARHHMRRAREQRVALV
ncbi:MAG: GntR family transcriptional regulator, partial [Actinomycetes bacterium]